MSLVALSGALILVFQEKILKRILLPLVAFSAGAMLGSAFFHNLPEAIEELGNGLSPFIWLVVGFSTFFLLEQFIHWHHCHRVPSEHSGGHTHKHPSPLTYLVLLGDALHNLIDGVLVAAAFIIEIRLGLVTLLAVAAHEIPQEIGDFGILIHGGWKRAKALLLNVVSGLTFLVGGLITYAFAQNVNIILVLPFAAGSFLYIAAADLIPEIKHEEDTGKKAIYFAAFILGLLLLLGVKLGFE